ncbi:MAG: T9SS type A sorting domain-containing protein [Bacteroidales bacterium]|nr:T9SS type A sorting domain-containing protein [Bacteroidales bacterium]
MKKCAFFLLLLLSLQGYAIWSPFGPEGIQANRICFILDMHPHWGICHDGGLYLYDLVSQTWTDHPAMLPVLDACYLDGENILVIMGDGTDSDGIYQYNPVSDQFELIQFIDSPNFIYYSESEQPYYIGHHLGLLTSPDGLTWTPIDTFNNKAIVTMDTYENHYVVSEMDNLYGVWYSDDSGNTWTLSPGSPMISCLGFDQEGLLYGIFPDGSYSSGLWSSPDFGQTWEVEFWSTEMSCVGFDYANVFVGWGNNAASPEQGVAWYHPETASLTFINDNLPNLIINQVTHNPSMSAIALFCCTENGAYVSYDYFLHVHEQHSPIPSSLFIRPNPAMTRAVLSFQPLQHTSPATLTILNLTGKKVWQTETDLSTGNIVLDCSGYIPGIYLVELKGNDFILSRKLIVK